jgi:hypothetical protein
MIHTFMWAFDKQDNWDYVEHIKGFFEAYNADIYYAELCAPLNVRLSRNITENRLLHKPSKRDIETSNQRVINMSEKNRFESLPGEITFENYIKIDNSDISPGDAARIIKERFGL